MNTALYDLSLKLNTYDYFTWQVLAAYAGFQKVSFRNDNIISRKWPVDESIKRFNNYLFPGPKLSGLEVDQLGKGDRYDGSFKLYDLALLPKFPRLKTVLPPSNEKYTVTLRQSPYKPFKNSEIAVWREFAQKIGAYIIEDAAVKPISLYERMALYAGAKMNYGVPNGCSSGLLILTEYPMMIFCDPLMTAKGWAGHHIFEGDQVPFALPTQKLVWHKPTLEDLLREHEANGV